jgi:hypothetical protein
MRWITSKPNCKPWLPNWKKATGLRYDPDRMGEAIRLSNQARALALEFNALRASRPAPVRGGPMLGVVGLGVWVLGLPDGVAHFRAWRDYTAGRVNRRDPEQPRQRVRLFWLHLRPYTESGLIAHLEDDLGAAIAFEEHNISGGRRWTGRPLRALAAKMLGHPSNGPVERRLKMILDVWPATSATVWFTSTIGAAARLPALARDPRPAAARASPARIGGDCIDPANLQTGPLRRYRLLSKRSS